jgi:NAD(P)-dependent dehydrogenase (short-subunit alcohol dehydrogenase family)
MTRTVLVTGASSGIGEATARRLARGGWRVLAGVRRDEDARRVREAGTTPLHLDVTEAESIAAAAETVGERLDGLVNNAGIALAAPLEFVPLDELRRQLEVNVVGQVAVTQAVLPALRRARGRIVNVGSIAGRSALPFLGPYAASKFALEAISDALRVELRPWGIEVVVVQPASIATPIWRRSAARADELADRLPRELTELYGEAIALVRRAAAATDERAEPPERVAAVIERALTATRPRTRYLVGKDAKRRARLERLPDRVRDRVLLRALARRA